MNKEEKNKLVPVWEKATLTLEEAVAYSGIGRDKLCKLADRDNCEFILWIGQKRLFKRKQLEEYIENSISI
jgi:excisionase family DNA binding protein